MDDQVEIDIRYKNKLIYITISEYEIAFLESILLDVVRDLIQDTVSVNH